MRGLKCHKSLYLHKYHPELRDKLTAQQEAIFTQGTNVGLLAQQLFPGGVDVSPESYFDFSKSIANTSRKPLPMEQPRSMKPLFYLMRYSVPSIFWLKMKMVGKILKEKYGDKMIDLVPDVDGYQLYGDRYSGIVKVEKFRIGLRGN